MPTAASGRAIMLSLRRLNCIDPGSGFSSPAPLSCRRISIGGLPGLTVHRRQGQLLVTISSLDHSKCGKQFRPRATKPLDYREWEYRKLRLPPHSERFTVLSYNILADYLATDHWHQLYYHIPRYIMDWNWRKKNIIFELGLWSADILCFQEVDRFQDLEAELKSRGYNGIWKMRTGYPVDGCAIFWRVSRFKMIFEESIEYNRLGLRDNVAQICVFESLNGRNISSGASTLSTSSASSNRVVVCNIHVLFNPKRGDIKLGQIRVLLERANAVSKLWNDAPIVLCGDFNCTPESPMYNFIKEKELDLSELARDKVSGQASAEINAPRPGYSDFRARRADNFTPAPEVNSKRVEQQDLPSDAQKLPRPNLSANPTSPGSYSQPGSSILVETIDSCSRQLNDLPNHDAVGTCATEGMSTPSVHHGVSNQSVSKVDGDIESPVSCDEGTDEISMLESSSKYLHSEATEGGEYVESDLQTLSETPDNQINHQCLSGNHSDDLSITSNYNSGSSETEDPSKNYCDANLSEHEAVAISASASMGNDKTCSLSASLKSSSSDIILDEKFEALTLDDATQEVIEDSESFLCELHSAGPSFPSTDGDLSSPNQRLEILNQNPKQESIFDTENFRFNPSTWTPAEIETATGRADCKVMEHPLKLTSAYTEVESSSGLRDSSGEPFVTSYHKRFSGSVDYIWHSQGLETVKVLAPIPKHVMHQTQGFPTKKWGSDHIALVSEFAFTKDLSSETPKQ
ncbi:LOW QUALITY PROTEIN: carbon catabolite repressor protein 4 homolog 6 [Salvia miltiorrhiza]|uniref:LOW QUALITY PROTEIN: carbon catabolite repressor protein 4 homolog 6 n=1 Tax=Salvia miltiorrhiza TaxID=226208 RepID=UPI0025ABC761|nr:LOW QUALITY PROTEIN: carbon catabolite repressor protein 4 homolog 6 [Salvia miltiorrhiza]